MALRIQAIWTGVGLGTSYTNLHFTGSGATQAQEAADKVTGFFGAISTAINNGVTFTLNTDVVDFDPLTGDPEAVWPVLDYDETGAEPTKRVPDVAQALIRLSTGTFRGSRRIRGRINIPGVSETRNEGGQVSLPTQSQLGNAVDDWLVTGSTPPQLAVWSRPTLGPFGVGILAPVVSSSVWSEWAMLGSRRF